MAEDTLMKRVIFALLVIAAGSIPALAKYSGGSGTAEDPYRISNYNDLYVLADDANDYNKCFIQTSDIDLNPNLEGRRNLTSALIAADINTSSGFQGTPFTGTFDGNDRKILNLSINGIDFIGLFGDINTGGSVSNLGLEDADIIGTGRCTGGLAGYDVNAVITNCHVSGKVRGYNYYVGGLAGRILGGTMTDCHATCEVNSSSYYVGGLVGYSGSSSIVSRCYTAGAVIGHYYTGGLMGGADTGTSVTNCYAAGTVSGLNDRIGGLMGNINTVTVTNSYATGFVSGSNYVGGLIGDGSNGTISNCYSAGHVSGKFFNTGGLLGHMTGTVSSSYFLTTSWPNNGYGAPLTDAQMKQQASFVGWDFVNIWHICEGFGYPKLNVCGKYSGGEGTSDDPFQIATPCDLLALAVDENDYNKCFILTADVNFQKQVFTTAIIAPDTGDMPFFVGTAFTGTFDGNGHKITNFTINGGINNFIGLFGYIGSNCSVKNLGLENCSVSGNEQVGGLCGRNQGGSITHCHSTGTVNGNDRTGGLCGVNEEGSINSSITDCYSTGNVTGGGGTGGLCGYNGGNVTNSYATGSVIGSQLVGGLCGSGGNITNCYSTGNVSGNDLTGGLVGAGGNITDCFSTSSVIGNNYTGGLLGRNYDNITNCYSTGSVSGSQYIGGLCGENYYGSVTGCYSTSNINGYAFTGGLCGYNNYGSISNGYSTGTVSGEYEFTGGLCGANENGSISDCYSTGSVSGNNDWTGGLCGGGVKNIINSYFLDVAGSNNGYGIPLSDTQMKQQASFVGWDFVDIWRICEGFDYPKLNIFGKYSGGSGTSVDPFRINSPCELLSLAANNTSDYNQCFILTADIDLDPNLPGNHVFTKAVIAPDTSSTSGFQGDIFRGTFDGNGHKIKNLTIDTNGANTYYLGLFGYIWGAVKNLGVENVSIAGGDFTNYIGGLAGYRYSYEIYNCYSTGVVAGGKYAWYVGGLVGYSKSSDITNCFSACNVIGGGDLGGLIGYDVESIISDCNSRGNITNYIRNGYAGFGGLVGYAEHSNINHCYATGDVNGDAYVGGLIGYQSGGTSFCYAAGNVTGDDVVGGLVGMKDYGIINNCYSTASVTGSSYWVGGLVGRNLEGNVEDSHSTGKITGYGNVGGLVGENDNDCVVKNCYSTGDTNGILNVGGLVGYNYGSISSGYFLITSGPDNECGEPLTDEQMKQQSSFAGWDFNSIWAICETTNYPRLQWQIPVADFVCPDGVNFADYSFFAQRWLNADCASNNNCDGTDFDFSGTVDIADLKIFCNYWLQGL